MVNFKTMLELTRRTYIFYKGKVYAPTFKQIEELEKNNKKLLNENYLIYRDKYIESIIGVMNIDEEWNKGYLKEVYKFLVQNNNNLPYIASMLGHEMRYGADYLVSVFTAYEGLNKENKTMQGLKNLLNFSKEESDKYLKNIYYSVNYFDKLKYEDNMSEMFIRVITSYTEFNFWDNWGNPVIRLILFYYYHLFRERISKMLYDEFYLYNDSEEDIPENEKIVEDLDKIRLYLAFRCNLAGSTSKFKKRFEDMSDDLARYLSVYILYISNLKDVFGENIVLYLRDLDIMVYNDVNTSNPIIDDIFEVEDDTLAEIYARINTPEMYMLNESDKTRLAKLDEIICEVDKHITEIEQALQSQVRILESEKFRDEVIYGFITKMMLDNTSIYATNVNVDSLPLKAAFTPIRKNREVAREYFNKIKKENLDVETLKFKPKTRLAVENILREWWEISGGSGEGPVRGVSIQVALKSIEEVKNQYLNSNPPIPATLEYQLVNPFTLRIVIKNDLIGQTNDVEQLKSTLKDAWGILNKKLEYKLKEPDEDLCTVLNKYGFNNYMFVHYDLPVYSGGN